MYCSSETKSESTFSIIADSTRTWKAPRENPSMTQDAGVDQGYFVITHRREIYNRLSRNCRTTSDMRLKLFVRNSWMIKRNSKNTLGEVALWPTMQSLSRSCDKELSCSDRATSRMTQRRCRSHYCTTSFGYLRPSSLWGCTIRLRLCSDRRKRRDPGEKFANLTLTLSPNWFDVPSIQTTRFRAFELWPHGIHRSSEPISEFVSTSGSVKSVLRVTSSTNW